VPAQYQQQLANYIQDIHYIDEEECTLKNKKNTIGRIYVHRPHVMQAFDGPCRAYLINCASRQTCTHTHTHTHTHTPHLHSFTQTYTHSHTAHTSHTSHASTAHTHARMHTSPTHRPPYKHIFCLKKRFPACCINERGRGGVASSEHRVGVGHAVLDRRGRHLQVCGGHVALTQRHQARLDELQLASHVRPSPLPPPSLPPFLCMCVHVLLCYFYCLFCL
jgi:hypothetical protein